MMCSVSEIQPISGRRERVCLWGSAAVDQRHCEAPWSLCGSGLHAPFQGQQLEANPPDPVLLVSFFGVLAAVFLVSWYRSKSWSCWGSCWWPEAVGLVSASVRTLTVYCAQLFIYSEFKLTKYWWGQLCLFPELDPRLVPVDQMQTDGGNS